MTPIPKEAIDLIKEYARENMRMATDSIKCDPILNGHDWSKENLEKNLELIDEGQQASTRYHAAKDILTLLGIPTDDL